MNQPYVNDLKRSTKENEFFREVVFTGASSQLVVMSLQRGEEIGSEVHDVDQLLYAVEGEGEAILDGVRYPFEKGTVVCVPAGVEHNFVNSDDEPLKLFTIYAPPQHPAGTVHRTKIDALAAEEVPAPA